MTFVVICQWVSVVTASRENHWRITPLMTKTMVVHNNLYIDSSPPSSTYMRRWTGSALVQVMACRLFGTKPLPELMLFYYQLDSREQISVKFELESYHFHSRKCIWNCRLPKWRPFCSGGDELIYIFTMKMPVQRTCPSMSGQHWVQSWIDSMSISTDQSLPFFI